MARSSANITEASVTRDSEAEVDLCCRPMIALDRRERTPKKGGARSRDQGEEDPRAVRDQFEPRDAAARATVTSLA